MKKFRISLTNQCNNKCVFCHNEGLDYDSYEVLDTGGIMRIVELAKKFSVNRFTLTGGEPLINKNIVEIVDCIREHCEESNISITTNGRLIDDSKLKKFVGKISKFGVNFQASNKSLLKEMTGYDTLEIIKSNIDLVLSYGIKVCLNMVYTNRNCEDFPNILDYAFEKGIDLKVIELVLSPENQSLYQDITELRNYLVNKCETHDFLTCTEERFGFGDTNTKVRIIYSYCNSRNLRACKGHGEIRIGPDLQIYPCLMSDECSIHLDDLEADNIDDFKYLLDKKQCYTPLTLAAVSVIEHNGHLVLVRRVSNCKLNGYWETLGGHVEKMETPEEAVVREVMEEANLEVLIEKKLGVLNNNNSICHYYKCSIVDENRLFSNDKIKLISLSDLATEQITPFARENLVKLGYLEC